MIDEIVCYIEEPPKIDCEIQQVKLVWENEHYPYRGETKAFAIDCKEDKTFLTKGTYLDEDIVIYGHGLDKYSGEYEYSALTQAKDDLVLQTNNKYFDNDINKNIVIKGHGLSAYEGEVVIEPSKEARTLPTEKRYLDTNIIIKPSEFDPYVDPSHEKEECFEYVSRSLATTTLKTKDKAVLKNIKILPNNIEIMPSSITNDDQSYTCYIQ